MREHDTLGSEHNHLFPSTNARHNRFDHRAVHRTDPEDGGLSTSGFPHQFPLVAVQSQRRTLKGSSQYPSSAQVTS